MKLSWWPALVGIVLAVLITLGTSGSQTAPILAASGLVYLAAAALRTPSAAWPMFFGTVVVITATRFGIIDVDATWVLLGLAVLLIGYGLLRGATHPTYGLPLQAVAMVGVGAMAATAMMVAGNVGAYLVAAGLLAHAAWDVYHHWTNRVVPRSMSEFCFVLDTLLAAGIVIGVVRGM